VIELGFPFSDPMAEGPTIQRASLRALEAGRRWLGDAGRWCGASRGSEDDPAHPPDPDGLSEPVLSYGYAGSPATPRRRAWTGC
jgi:tryptophan synthase alpha chain